MDNVRQLTIAVTSRCVHGQDPALTMIDSRQPSLGRLEEIKGECTERIWSGALLLRKLHSYIDKFPDL